MAKKRKDKAVSIATAGVLLALILIFLLVPIPSISGVSLAVIALIAVIVGCQFEGIWMGLFCGVAFGLTSLIGSFTTGAGSLLAPVFHNPLISVLPRAIVPVTTYFSFIGIRLLIKKIIEQKKKFNEKGVNHISMLLSSGISAAVAVTTNTGLVFLLTIAFNAGTKLSNNEVISMAYLWSVFVSNYIIELIICVVATPPIIVALKSAFHKSTDKYSPKMKVTLESSIIESDKSENNELIDNDAHKEVNVNIDVDNSNISVDNQGE